MFGDDEDEDDDGTVGGFKFFEEGCEDCFTPATNISIGDGKCSECAGLGHDEMMNDCTNCEGSGKCPTCDGKGKH